LHITVGSHNAKDNQFNLAHHDSISLSIFSVLEDDDGELILLRGKFGGLEMLLGEADEGRGST